MWSFLIKDIEIQDKKIFKCIVIGMIYFCSIILILKVGEYFLTLPFVLLNKYNISVEEINLLYGNSYIWGIIGIMIISILGLPTYITMNRIKKIRKR